MVDIRHCPVAEAVMKKLHAVSFSLLMALTQVLPAPLWAQTPPPPAAPPPPPPPPPPAPAAPAPVMDNSAFGTPSLSADECRPVQLGGMPLTMNPPVEWRDKLVQMYATIRQDGGIGDLKLVGASGVSSLDEAAMAHIRQTARFAPLRCGRTSSSQRIGVSIPRATCLVRNGWRPALPLALAQPRRGVTAGVQVSVAPDGRLADSSLYIRSGDAALDMALLAHVRETWRFYPMAEGCDSVTERFFIRFPEAACIARPLMESRTLPSVARAAGRAVSLQVGVGHDGKPLFTNVMQSSGDAALDAAAAAHVKEAWRWEPITCPRAQPRFTDTPLPVLDTVRVAFPGEGT
jgi:outer membrane biosynthesis protein TonB